MPRVISPTTLVILVAITLIAAKAVFYLESYEPDVASLPENTAQEPLTCPEQPTETSLARMPAPETSPGWVLFDSDASGQISRNTHFSLEHPAGWNKDSYANHSYAATVIADYDLTKSVPDPEREGVGTQYVPKEHCRVLIKTSVDFVAPEVYYENTYITPELKTACEQILKKIQTTFRYYPPTVAPTDTP